MSAHPAHALEIPHFPGTFTQTQGLFFSAVLTHRVDAPVLLETFTPKAGLLFSGFCTSCRCSRNSASSWDIYLDKGVVLFLGFPHTTSLRCSSFSQDIYTNTGVVFFRFSTQLKLLIPSFLGIPLTHTKIYQDSAHL